MVYALLLRLFFFDKIYCVFSFEILFLLYASLSNDLDSHERNKFIRNVNAKILGKRKMKQLNRFGIIKLEFIANLFQDEKFIKINTNKNWVRILKSLK